MKRTIIYSAIIITALVMTPIVFAESTTVINNVSVSASTGGNSANGGIIKNGTSKARVFIKTTVNGEVVEYVDKAVESLDGKPVKIEKNTHYETGNVRVDIKNTASVSGNSKEITQSADSQISQVKIQNKKVERSNSDNIGKSSSFLATIFQKLINYVFSIFRK